MHVRLLLSGSLLFAFVTDVTAQNRIRWRPGAILEGLADTVQEVARDVGVRELPAAAEIAEDGEVDGQRADIDLPKRSRPPGITTQIDAETLRAVSVDDVILMTHRGLGESTIVQFIGDNGVKQRLNVSDLLRLHEEGVSEPIILAMQTSKIVEGAPHPTRVLPTFNRGRGRSASQAAAAPQGQLDIERFGPSILMSAPDDANKVGGSSNSKATID